MNPYEDDEGLDLQDIPEIPQESSVDYVKRTGKRTIANVASTVVGLPGDVYQSFKALGEGLESYVPSFLQQGEPNFVQKSFQKILGQLPTRESVMERGIAQDPSLAPQSENEALYDEIVSDFTSLAIPVKGKIPFFRALGTSVVSNVAKEVVKSFGFGDKTQAFTKIGAMFISGLIGRQSAKEGVLKLYESADSALPEGARTDAKILTKEAENIFAETSRGATTPTKTALNKYSSDVLKNIDADGKIAIEDVARLRRDLNEIRGDPSLLERYEKRLNVWDKRLSDIAKQYGEENPRWYKLYSDANEGFAGLKQSERAVKNILRVADPKNLSASTSLILGLSGPGAAAAHLGKAATAVSIASGYKMLTRVAMNPTLRRLYMDTMTSSLKGNTAVIAQNVRRLDKKMREIEEENQMKNRVDLLNLMEE